MTTREKKKGPGRSHRNGMSILQLLDMFPDNASAEKWFEEMRWPGGNRFCPECGSIRYTTLKSRKPMPYRCLDCRSHFSVKKGTVMQSSKIGLRKWAIALYMMTTGIKGTSSMKIYRELKMRQATAWFLMHRIREGFLEGQGRPFPGPVEVDETYIGGKEKNKHANKKLRAGRGGVGKKPVAGIKDRESKQIKVKVVNKVNKDELQGFVTQNTTPDAKVYTDEHRAYVGLSRSHEAIKHSVGEYVRDQAHTNGIESFWALFKRGYTGTYHKMSEEHLKRYVSEFAGRHNIRDMDTMAQMGWLAKGMIGKRLTYAALTQSI